MKNWKPMWYYVVAAGKRYSFGRATRDMLKAQMALAEARRMYPGEVWDIVALAA